MSHRSQEVLRQTPPATLAALATCAVLHLLQVVTSSPPLQTLTLCPQLVVYQGDAYRMVTSALFHGSFVHIGMNLMSTAAIGTTLEKRVGTISLLLTLLWSILLTSTIYISIALLWLWLLDREGLMRQHSIGFSGVLFHLLVLECNLGTAQQARDIFGFFRVSPKLYPWALLVSLQVVVPGLSFTGHLAGILAGQLQYFQCFDFLFPTNSYLREIDSWSILSSITKYPSYVRTPASDDTFLRDPPPTITGLLCWAYQMSARCLYQLCEVLYVIVFGRGAEANANTRLPLSAHPTHPRQQVARNAHDSADDSSPPPRQDVV